MTPSLSQVITEKIRGDEVSAAVLADWRFAAMVLDRNGVSFSRSLMNYLTFTFNYRYTFKCCGLK